MDKPQQTEVDKETEEEIERKQFRLAIGVLIASIICVCLYHIRSINDRNNHVVNPVDLDDTILVLIVSPANRDTAVATTTKPPILNTIEGLYNNAYEPSRVMVAAYDMNDHLKNQLPVQLQPSVRVARNMKTIQSKHSSASDARAYLMKHLYRGERYVMTLQSNAEICKDWDKILIDMIKPIKNRHTIFTSAVMPKNMQSNIRPTYFKLNALKGGKMVIEPSKVHEVPEDPVPSIFWSPSLSFAPAPAYKEFVDGNIISSDDMDITLNTIKLWTNGFNFYTLPITMAWASRPEDSNWTHSSKRSMSKTATVGTARTFKDFEQYVGISFERKKASKRTYHGLTNHVTAFEAGVKVGSLEAARLANHMKH